MDGVALKCPRPELLVAMNTRKLDLKKGVIVYDADVMSRAGFQLGEEHFSADWWEHQGNVRARNRGRGSALTIAAPFGRSVLRRYLRGGWPARFSQSSYVFTGFERSRPIGEFRVLEELKTLGLRAPRPLAASSASLCS